MLGGLISSGMILPKSHDDNNPSERGESRSKPTNPGIQWKAFWTRARHAGPPSSLLVLRNPGPKGWLTKPYKSWDKPSTGDSDFAGPSRVFFRQPTYGGFHKWGYPPIIHFNGISLRNQPFWGTPIWGNHHMDVGVEWWKKNPWDNLHQYFLGDSNEQLGRSV